SRLWQSTDGTNAPDVYISYLRRKLTPILGEGFIINVRGAGYMIREN
ncbi:MAG: helix-turn-helix domain-containing protein, partial [Clostridia bacterium]|nr:helix-turn-helix domain-containing protein [Clostridia bacterium]